jgi:hypothetical protein
LVFDAKIIYKNGDSGKSTFAIIKWIREVNFSFLTSNVYRAVSTSSIFPVFAGSAW